MFYQSFNMLNKVEKQVKDLNILHNLPPIKRLLTTFQHRA